MSAIMDLDDQPELEHETNGQEPGGQLEVHRTGPTSLYPSTRSQMRAKFRDLHDVATVLVGPSAAKYTLHTGLLTSASPFFAAALGGHFSEAHDQTVSLPEERPDIFEWFVQWLYSGSLTSASPTNCTAPAPLASSNRGHHSTSTHDSTTDKFLPVHGDGELRNSAGSPKYFLLIELYGLSDRLLTTSLSNHIIDTVARLSEATNSVPTPSDTWILYGDCASFSGARHCGCGTHPRALAQPQSPTPPLRRKDSAVDLDQPTPRTCPLYPGKPPSQPHREGIRPSAPLRELVLDLFTYKKTDRLLSTHRDDWHPLFLRDLVVRLKRPGAEWLARHRALTPFAPRAWADARGCEACRGVVGPTAVGLGIRGATWPGAGRSARRRVVRGRNVRGGGQPLDGMDVDGDGDGAAPVFESAMRCEACDRVYCLDCLTAAFAGAGLERGEGRFALVGADVGGCKPWLSWSRVLAGGAAGGERWNGDGVCGRYHEHGPFGGMGEC